MEIWLKAKTHLLAPQRPQTAKVQTVDATEMELVLGAVKASVAAVAELDSASTLEAIRVRESTLTDVMEKILEFRPSFHWGINE
ncbi:hypothetical protein SBV1_2780003 [Verrucomicrobia bacterium]|nr:hypothetical protein SBV1_2780003 [Verrucomicrobiota bacterium]